MWPCNRLAVRAFMRVRTQWRRDDGTATGLDGAAVEPKIARFARQQGLDQDAEDRIHEDLDLMESHIIAEWSRQAEQRRRELERKKSRLPRGRSA